MIAYCTIRVDEFAYAHTLSLPLAVPRTTNASVLQSLPFVLFVPHSFFIAFQSHDCIYILAMYGTQHAVLNCKSTCESLHSEQFVCTRRRNIQRILLQATASVRSVQRACVCIRMCGVNVYVIGVRRDTATNSFYRESTLIFCCVSVSF